MRAALRPTSVRQYAATNKRFFKWKADQWDPKPLSEVTVYEYLTIFANIRFTFSYVRNIYSGLRFYFFRNFPEVKFNDKACDDFLRGASNVCKRSLRKHYTWNPQQYVDFIVSKPWPTRLAKLAAETATILALTAVKRGADMMNLGADVSVAVGSIQIPYLDRNKTRVDGKDEECLEFAQYPGSDRVCAMTMVQLYVEMSKLHYQRKGWERPAALFVSSTAPKPVEIATLRGWLVREIREAGIRDPEGNVVSAHQLRHAAASHAFYFRGYSFDRIAILAGWACESTFTKHYKRKIQQPLDNLLPHHAIPYDPERDLELSTLEDEEIETDKIFCFSCFSFRCFTPLECAETLRFVALAT